MSDTAIGVLGTLAGTILGFGLLWIKELIDESKEIKIIIKELSIYVSDHRINGPYQFEFTLNLIVTNPSIIRQPIWDLELLTDNPVGVYKVKEQSSKGSKEDQYEPAGMISIDPKTSAKYNYSWTIRTGLTAAALEQTEFKFSYHTRLKKITDSVKPEIVDNTIKQNK